MTRRHHLRMFRRLGTTAILLAARVQAQDDTNEIPQIKPPHAALPPTYWELHGTIIMMAGVVFLALVGFVIWALTRPRPPVVIPPAVAAREALAALPALASEGERLSRVSQIVRHYVQQAFDLPRVELNTTEFCQVVAAHPALGPELAAALAAFLQDSDRRKFSPAPAPANAVDAVNAVTRALGLIEQGETRREHLRVQTVAANRKPAA